MRVLPQFVLSAVAAVVLASVSFAAELPDLSGSYKCVGDAGNGKQYQGAVEIAKEGDGYRVTWQIAKDKFTGAGLQEGNTLSVAYRQDGSDTFVGLAVYKVEKGGKLVGRWTSLGSKGQTLTETLTPEKEEKAPARDKEPAAKVESLDGTWELVSRTTDGSEMTGIKNLQYRVKIDGKKWATLIKGKATDTDTIVVNAGKTPAAIDRTNPEDKETQYGIYTLDGDTLTTAFGPPDGKRPEKFEAGKGSGVSLSVYRRVK